MDKTRRYYNIYSMWGISPFPRDFIVDQQGVIRYQSSEYNPQYMQKVINQLLKNKLLEINYSDKLNLLVYPNPFNSITNVEFTPKSIGKYNFYLYDIIGRVLIKEELEINSVERKFIYSLDLKKYASGLYFISLSDQNISEYKKLVLLK